MNDAESTPSPKRFCRKFGIRSAAENAPAATEFPRKCANTLPRTRPAMRLRRIPVAPRPVMRPGVRKAPRALREARWRWRGARGARAPAEVVKIARLRPALPCREPRPADRRARPPRGIRKLGAGVQEGDHLRAGEIL